MGDESELTIEELEINKALDTDPTVSTEFKLNNYCNKNLPNPPQLDDPPLPVILKFWIIQLFIDTIVPLATNPPIFLFFVNNF